MLLNKTLKGNIFAVLAISFVSTLLQYFIIHEIYFLQTFIGTLIGMSIGFYLFYMIENKIESYKENKKSRIEIE